jgi:hypothetical protein
MGITHVDNLIQPDKNGELYKARGIHWALAALFIVADTAGAGLVALPAAVVRCREFQIFLSPKILKLLNMIIFNIFSLKFNNSKNLNRINLFFI